MTLAAEPYIGWLTASRSAAACIIRIRLSVVLAARIGKLRRRPRGVFVVSLTITDPGVDGLDNLAYGAFQYVVVYDPDSGFVTGGG